MAQPHTPDLRADSPELGVAIVEDRDEIREGLGMLIDASPGYRCVGRWASVEAALSGLQGADPDVLLLDIQLPGMSGIEAIPILRQRFPGLEILMLSVYDDDDRIFRALCAGASGYLLKKTPPTELLAALRSAADGGSPMSPGVARRVVRLFRRFRPEGRADYDLTPHERRVLRMLVDGHNYRSAASELGVSVNTVAFHVKGIYRKLEVHSKTEAVSKALRAGLVD